MSLFETAVSRVLEDEGGYSDSPNDPGGTTNYGISIRFAGSIDLDIDGDGQTTNADIIALTPERAREVFKQYFWNENKCGEMPAGVGYALFDGAVNQGSIAVKYLQRASGAYADGLVGLQTLGAVRSADKAKLLDDYCTMRALHYAGLSTFKMFGRGWFKRLFRVHRLACGD